MSRTSKEDCRIEVTRHTHRQIIVMPRYGGKNIVEREKAVSLPRVRFLEAPDKPIEAKP
jgi:hypothetical protein